MTATATLTPLLLGTAAVGSGLVGGVFFTFSGFVLPALARLPASAGVSAMQAVNRAAVTPPLMTALFGTAAVAAAVAVTAVPALRADDGATRTPALLAMGGAALYLAAGVLVTVAANVPLNDRLAGVDAGTPAAAQTWERYVRVWGGWNHVRTLGCLAASALLTAAALRPAGPA
ncbi:DUF1772 domain-containing protein [Streptomyces sp. NP160]|uniref:anthrone oxygenase family protein n=1 Tax=Streptomyces sp. NP160 TaxID=2586637 RepID=UPI00111B5F6F|nr:anthrone oxygenase family protein [Streptomyces sp. NP160]TNM64411.1 DUF1772 domain-containing protein [Streptomyces sp. NP160]